MLRKIIHFSVRFCILGQRAFRQFGAQPFCQLLRLSQGAGHHQLRRLEAVQLLKNVRQFVMAPGQKPLAFASGNIGHCHAQLVLILQKQHQITIMLVLQELLIQRRARSNNFDDLALHDTLSEARILHLLTNGNAISLLHKLGNITLHAVVGHAAHGNIVPTASSFSQSNIQFSGRCQRILKKHFVKVTQAEEKQLVFMLLLHSKILLHHGRVIIFSSH